MQDFPAAFKHLSQCKGMEHNAIGNDGKRQGHRYRQHGIHQRRTVRKDPRRHFRVRKRHPDAGHGKVRHLHNKPSARERGCFCRCRHRPCRLDFRRKREKRIRRFPVQFDQRFRSADGNGAAQRKLGQGLQENRCQPEKFIRRQKHFRRYGKI